MKNNVYLPYASLVSIAILFEANIDWYSNSHIITTGYPIIQEFTILWPNCGWKTGLTKQQKHRTVILHLAKTANTHIRTYIQPIFPAVQACKRTNTGGHSCMVPLIWTVLHTTAWWNKKNPPSIMCRGKNDHCDVLMPQVLLATFCLLRQTRLNIPPPSPTC